MGIVTALPIEAAAIIVVMGETTEYHKPDDPNTYRLGYLPSTDPECPHRVVLVVLPVDNTRNAAAVSTHLLRSFRGVRVLILVGVAGGVPAPAQPGRHVRLGDVVVATDGVIDLGHIRHENGRETVRRPLGNVSAALMRAAAQVEIDALLGTRPWESVIDLASGSVRKIFARPPDRTDLLVVRRQRIKHPSRVRSGHVRGRPKVHRAPIGSSDVLLRDERRRDQWAREYGIVAVEMEGSGVAAGAWQDGIEWFMVRGIVDYCEASTKNDRWHGYSSLAAAAYTHAVLARCSPAPATALQTPHVLPMLPAEECELAYELLADAPAALKLGSAWRAATADLASALQMRPATLQQGFEYLLHLNSEPDGVPRVVVFVDRLAQDAPSDLRQRLFEWSDRQARLLGLTGALHARRSRAETPSALPCLVVELSPDRLDTDQFTIRHWLQEHTGEWAPTPGETLSLVTQEQAQRIVELLVADAEAAWQDSQETVTVEFLLPVALLNLPVDWWSSDSTFSEPPPLCLDYPVVVRSLERMRAKRRYRMWRRRWVHAREEPAPTIRWGRVQLGESDLSRWGAELLSSEPVFTVVVLSGPPTEPDLGQNELALALRAGVPVVLWDRRTESPDDMRNVMARLLAEGGTAELPERVRELRFAAARAQPRERHQHPGKHLALLWDDPSRPVE